jgi:hypothetical protein
MEANIAASRKTNILALLPAVLILVIGGGLVGMAAGLVGSFFYLAIVFPIGMGFAGMWVAEAAARAGRVREKSRVLVVFVLTALVLYGAFHYSRYLVFQAGSWLALSKEGGAQMDMALARALTNYALRQETGHAGFFGYLLLRAKDGVSIGRFYSQNRLALTGFLVWLYWAVEFGLILWIMQGGVKDYLRVPVCETCGRRLGREHHLGGTTPANEPLLLDLLGRHDLAGLGGLLVKDAGLPSVELYMRKCDRCGQSTSVLTVRRARLGTRGVVLSDVSKATLPAQEGTLFLQQLRFEVD